ncbi:MAG: cysS [Candidatus Saccharibacteria bacterium]|nr:cysS [Candidatus Saccharibacteria bacterium]
MKLHNTSTRKVEDLQPLKDNTVRIYSCGPTVYDHAHIGNLSAYIFADTLHRVVSQAGHGVQHAMNYTDVDDKTIRRSREQYPDKDPKEALQTLTDHYIDVFMDDMQKIGNDVGSISFIRATDEKTIKGMQELIANLHAQGFAYTADDGVYFSIEAYRASGKIYGQLLELTDGNTSEARIQNDEYDKESVHDFALWKKQKEGEPAWEFNLDGQDMTGRPGWHIECSVMSEQALGQPFDIHTGGIDLIFPHHENEIAQSTALEENPSMATMFAHNEHILVDGKKMSKSASNFYTLKDITDNEKGFDPLAFRLMVLQAHYRNQVNFTWESLGSAQYRLRNLRQLAQLQHQQNIVTDQGGITAEEIQGYAERFRTALFDDIDTPGALSSFSNLENTVRANQLQNEDAWDAFKQFLQLIDETLGLDLTKESDITEEQKQLLQAQDNAWREAKATTKDFSASDELRNELETKHHIIVSNYNDRGFLWSRI